MAVICRSHRLLFIMAPRTGCTAVGKLLRDELEGEDIPPADHPAVVNRGLEQKHITLRQLLKMGLVSPEERAELYVFTTVRNPFDSLFSLYTKQAAGYPNLEVDREQFVKRSRQRQRSFRSAQQSTFEEWLVSNYEKSVRRSISRGLRALRGERNKWLAGVDFVMRYERLQEDLDAVLLRAGVTRRLVIPKVNVTPGRERDYRAYYTERARRVVEDRFAHELAEFGYTF